MNKIKCCGAEVKQRYMSRTDNVGEMYCTKCDRECEVVECDTIDQKELQRADDIIGHDVSGTESIQMKDKLHSKCCEETNKEQDKERIEEIKKVIVENSECIPSEMSELVDTLIASIRDEAYEKGFIAGADATGSQAEEVLALKLKEQENEIIKKIAHKEVHCELKGYKIGKKEMKKKILELIYGEIKKTTKDEKDTRSCECLENIYQKIKELKINSF